MGGVAIEHLERFKYLGTVLDHKLTFSDNTDTIYKKCQVILLRKLRSMDLNIDLLQSFY